MPIQSPVSKSQEYIEYATKRTVIVVVVYSLEF